MSNFELEIPYSGARPSSLDYYFDQVSGQLVLTVSIADKDDWRISKNIHFIFEGVNAVIGSSALFETNDIRMNGIYRAQREAGKPIKFAFRYSADDIKYIYAESVRQA